MELTKEVRTMTTKEEVKAQQGMRPAFPETLTEEHHEAIKASWELPAYEREYPPVPAPRSSRTLLVGIVTGAVCLAVGFGGGYWAHTQVVETAAPIVISRVAGPVDANGMNLGRRLAPEPALPSGVLPGPVDANGMNLGRRLAPEADLPSGVLPGPVDANGMTLGRRLAPIE
jgi:hypothetical protein